MKLLRALPIALAILLALPSGAAAALTYSVNNTAGAPADETGRE